MTNNLIEFKNVTKKYGKKLALDNCSFHIKKGTITGIIGPNGSGKTTAMKLIMELIHLTTGQIIYHDSLLSKNQFKKMTALIEEPQFYRNLTGYQNLKYLLAHNPNVSDEHIVQMIEKLQMNGYIHQKVRKYSLGMRQRLGIAYALIGNNDLIILDEPMNGLDPLGIKEVRILLKEYVKQQNGTVFISSHMLRELQDLCDEIIIINQGKILKQLVFDFNLIYHIRFFDSSECLLAANLLKQLNYSFRKKHIDLFIPLNDETKISEIIQLLAKFNIREVRPVVNNLEEIYVENIMGDPTC